LRDGEPTRLHGRFDRRDDTQVTSEAERNAAKSLGIDPVAVYELACRLWHHAVDQERGSRVGEGGRPIIKDRLPGGTSPGQLVRSFEPRTL